MDYIAILRRPGLAWLVCVTALARLAFGINPLAVLLYVHERQGSFAIAGVVASAMALGSAVGGPIQGRVVDRRGLRPLFALSGIYAFAMGGLLLLCAGSAPVPLQMLSAFAVGASLPVSTSVLRARWPELVYDRPDLLTAAYALDSMLIEVAFVMGPVITAAAVATRGADLALIVSGLIGAVGSIGFIAALLKRTRRAQVIEVSSPMGPLSSSGVRVLSIASLPLGFYLGSLDVGLPAYGAAAGIPAFSGILLAILAFASASAVLVYGLWKPRAHLWDIHLAFSVMLAFAALPLACSSGPGVAAPATALAGIPVAIVIASRNQLVREVAPEGTESEAFTWPLTAMICGISIGAAVGGQLIEMWGWRAPVLAGSCVAALGFASLLVMRRRVHTELAHANSL